MNFRKRKPTNNPFFLPADQILKIIRFQTVFVDDVEAILSIRDPVQNLLPGLVNFFLAVFGGLFAGTLLFFLLFHAIEICKERKYHALHHPNS